jgi:very-short-patch-repair endonuclease
MPNNKHSKINGRFVKHATYVNKICENCGIEFEIKQSALKYGRGKCCSRKCVDENKKRTYAGKNNPSYGRVQSAEEKARRGTAISEAYKNDPSIKDRQKAGIQKYIEKTGYFPGTSPTSIQKRKKTNLERYGVEWAGWNVPEIKERAENTCIERYGKSSLELAMDSLLNTKFTRPEQIVKECLDELQIKYIPQYKLFVDGIYRHFDFMLVDFNILIEVDGDFWHANPMLYDRNNLHEVQIRTIENDAIKNEMVRKAKITLVRFWESEITPETILEKLKEVLYEKGEIKKN